MCFSLSGRLDGLFGENSILKREWRYVSFVHYSCELRSVLSSDIHICKPPLLISVDCKDASYMADNLRRIQAVK